MSETTSHILTLASSPETPTTESTDALLARFDAELDAPWTAFDAYRDLVVNSEEPTDLELEGDVIENYRTLGWTIGHTPGTRAYRFWRKCQVTTAPPVRVEPATGRRTR